MGAVVPVAMSARVCSNPGVTAEPRLPRLRRPREIVMPPEEGQRIARPLPEWTGHKYDFNDLLREQGPGAVLDRIAVARAELREQHIADLAAQKFTLADHPPFALPTATAAEVHAATLHAVHTFFMQRGIQPAGAHGGAGPDRQRQDPRRWASCCRTSSPPTRRSDCCRAGKACRTGLSSWSRRIASAVRSSNATRPSVCPSPPSRVAAIRGGLRSRPDPNLCRNLDAVGLAVLAHQDVRSAVCGKANGKRCPFFEGCGYLAQFERARDADVLIVAHEFMFERLPKSVLHDVAYVIIEEDFIPTGDAIAELPVDVLRAHAINSRARARSRRRDGRGEDR